MVLTRITTTTDTVSYTHLDVYKRQTVFTLAAAGSVTTITGHYQKLTDFGGMGAMITMGGFSSAITDAVHGARKEGMGAGRALWRGVKDGLFILFAGYLAAVVSVVVMYAAGRI